MDEGINSKNAAVNEGQPSVTNIIQWSAMSQWMCGLRSSTVQAHNQEQLPDNARLPRSVKVVPNEKKVPRSPELITQTKRLRLS